MEYNSVILIVDDEEVGREALEVLLYGENYRLVFASDGREGLRKAIEVRPDLILLDIRMPEMDGFEACRHIRAHRLLSEVPVIMVTSLDDQESRLRGIEAGADDFISKPYNRAELRTRVKTITKLNRYRRLHQERENFQWVVEQSDDGYLMINTKEEIIYANSRARDYLALPEEGTMPVGETFMDLARRQYCFEPQEAWSSWPGISIKSPLYLLRPETENSSVFWLQVDLIKMLVGPASFLIRLRNVTERIVTRSNVWTFHDLVAHKFRTPLTSLEFIFDFLNKGWKHLTSEQIEKFIRDGHNAISSIQKQILDVLNCIESQEVLRAGQTRTTIEEICNTIDELKKEMKLETVLVSPSEIDNPAETCIAFSLAATEIVLRELFSNARKFHPENSPEIKITINPVADGMRFQIFDNGLSLSPEQLRDMWVPYNQAEKYFTGQLPGMGLGLFTVASMVWSAGGKCKSYNRSDGPGIIIEIILPVKTA